MLDLSSIIILGLFIIFIAAIVQGTTGFGFALTSMPLLTLLMPLYTAVPIMVIFGFFANVLILFKVWPQVSLKKIWLLIVSSVIAAPLGTYLLVMIEQSVLKIITGFIIVLFSLALWKGFSVKIKYEKLALIPVGFTSGLLNGSVSLMGPPVVLFLTNQDEDKAIFRANITVYGLILNIITIASFFMEGLINEEVMKYILFFTPALIFGTIIGMKLVNKVDQALFKKITLLLIIISGLSAIFTTVY